MFMFDDKAPGNCGPCIGVEDMTPSDLQAEINFVDGVEKDEGGEPEPVHTDTRAEPKQLSAPPVEAVIVDVETTA